MKLNFRYREQNVTCALGKVNIIRERGENWNSVDWEKNKTNDNINFAFSLYNCSSDE